MRSAIVVLAVFAAFFVHPPDAKAHAQLDHATPAVGSAITPPPKEVTLWFTEAVEPKFSSIEVRDANGAAMQRGAAGGVSGNTAQLRVEVRPLPPGIYTVKWRVLSVDTHRTQGSFSFTVEP
jgi:hypothetical protein